MFDIKKLEAEAATELAAEKATALKYIADVKAILRSLEDEYAVLLKDIADAKAVLRSLVDEYAVILKDIGA